MNRQLLTILLLAFTINVFAQGPPITTGTPVMLGLEGNGIRTFGKIISKENTNIYVQPIGIPYNISPKFQIGGILPFKFITPKRAETNGGIADVTLFTKYQLYKKDEKAKTFRVLANIKQSFPTGKTSSIPQIGSGIYQTYVGFIVGKISSAIGIYGDFGYNITSNGASDNFLYNFSVGVPLLPQKYPQKQINTFLEFNGNYVFNPKIHTLFISPGLQFIPGRRILFETSFQMPIVQNNISTNKTKYMLLLGTRFLIN
ncbi:hypothetical protein [Ancylomarina longa]|uniref:Outer membrane protein beta-barrel domain-containing protein n=1 Tax=Ancylomarina longa TaxID=2487017 RepID=A0A434AG03_9BACT|nr:hypothetical protein [Ancylomarina longa]RUT73310.1 hypothetical protein DLK05_14150 [Ancylomarina longa]